ncbi:unnamed protein product [Blepharisma stoltei]|uniref:Palmitoyltransferase n=1 Tax=Blepharisma stoltei TaxID=1481888 RepID=A0AAU9K2X6_9CILI|nr:unnamed protein product [Blepharisma stoltei]
MNTRKQNGFSRPYHPFQIATWLMSLFLVAVAILITLILETSLQIVFSLLFWPAQILYWILGVLATCSDPTDPLVYQQEYAINNGLSFDERNREAVCTICSFYVAGNSKHCGYCNRCVSDFDHHCKWLNNCIGGKNYKLFIYLIVVLEINGLIFIIFGLYTIIDRYSYQETKEKWIDIYGETGEQVIDAFIFFQTSISLAVFLANGKLIIFHIWLRSNGMTTYDYICQMRKKNKIMSHTEATSGEKADVNSNRSNEEISPRNHYPETKTLIGTSEELKIVEGATMRPSDTDSFENHKNLSG